MSERGWDAVTKAARILKRRDSLWLVSGRHGRVCGTDARILEMAVLCSLSEAKMSAGSEEVLEV